MCVVVLRVWLPDRPGALGQVASRIGAVRGDVLSIEILERGGGQVVDELTIELTDDALVPLLTAEVGAVDGVSVESIRRVDPDRADPSLLALAIGTGIVDSSTTEPTSLLTAGVAQLVEADWVALVSTERVVDSLGRPPPEAWLLAFARGSGHLTESGHDQPDLLWAPLRRSGMAIAAGRADRPIHRRERERVALLGRLADAVLVEAIGS